MSRILLDTSAYSAFMRGEEVVKRVLQEAEQIYLTPVVLGELLSGFMKGARRRANEKELEQFLSSPRVGIVPINEETSERYASILHSLRQTGTPVPTNDIWIAASAMQHGMKILTRDLHFSKIPQIMVMNSE